MDSQTHTITVTIKLITDVSCYHTCTECYDRKAKYIVIANKFYPDYEICEVCYQNEFEN